MAGHDRIRGRVGRARNSKEEVLRPLPDKKARFQRVSGRQSLLKGKTATRCSHSAFGNASRRIAVRNGKKLDAGDGLGSLLALRLYWNLLLSSW
jgi:hypothetical protein